MPGKQLSTQGEKADKQRGNLSGPTAVNLFDSVINHHNLRMIFRARGPGAGAAIRSMGNVQNDVSCLLAIMT